MFATTYVFMDKLEKNQHILVEKSALSEAMVKCG